MSDDNGVTGVLGLPDLSHLAYSVDDGGDHPGGGHCMSLPDDDTGQWETLLGQHLQALEELVGRARELRDRGGDGGWTLSRPVLFAAHHTCEVAIKFALVLLGEEPPREHDLSRLKQQLDVSGGISHLGTEGGAWVDEFLARMRTITSSGFDGRYPIVGGDVGQRWCCLNVDLLAQAVGDFVGLVLAKVDPASDES